MSGQTPESITEARARSAAHLAELSKPQPAPELADSCPASMLAPVRFNDEPELAGHISVRFPADMIAAAKQLATAEGMTVSAWIRREIEREAERREQPAPEVAADTEPHPAPELRDAMAETRTMRSVLSEVLASFEQLSDGRWHAKVGDRVLTQWAKRAGLPT